MRKNIEPHGYCPIFTQHLEASWSCGLGKHHLPHLSKTDLEIKFSYFWLVLLFCVVLMGEIPWSFSLLSSLHWRCLCISTGKNLDICSYSYIYMHIWYAYLRYGKETESIRGCSRIFWVWHLQMTKTSPLQSSMKTCGVSQRPWISQMRQKVELSLWTWAPCRPQDGINCFQEHSWDVLHPDSKNFHHQGKTFHFLSYFLLENIH